MESNKTNKNMPFLDLIWHYKYLLAFYIFLISFGSFTLLYVLGFVPDELKLLDNANDFTNSASIIQTNIKENIVKKDEVQNIAGQLPKRIIISKIGVDSFISNPVKNDISALNEALLKGTVRYPGSGTLGKGNVFLFGHSTGFRVVNNQAYKAFNHLNQLNPGDIIKVWSEDKEYVYSVVSVSLVDSSEKLVDFSKNKNMLTLSTCDVFGEKQERYVVEAVFVSHKNL